MRRWALTQVRPEIAEEEWHFALGPHGKPELAAPFAALGLHHNLSHGGDYAAVLVADAPCGVDVEPPAGSLDAAAVVLDTQNRAEIAAHPRPEQRFLQHWVAKEAALKLTGVGFSAGSEQVALSLAPDGLSAVSRNSHLPPNLRLRLWPLDEGHWLAAALLGSVETLRPTLVPWLETHR